MQSFTMLIALTALVLSATALPVERRQSQLPCPDEYPQYYELKGNQSTVFALQLVGSSLSQEDIDNTCQHLSEGCDGKLADQGLDVANMTNIVCNAQGSQPNATLALPKVVEAKTKVFTTQLLNSFNPVDNTNFRYLCSNIQYNLISSFFLSDTQIISEACSTANTAPLPQPFTPLTEANASAVDQYHYSASKLYAYEYASTATSASQLDQFCAHAPAYHDNWRLLQLQPDVVEATLCSIKQPITVDEAKAQLLKWSSMQFLAVIENIVSLNGYNDWLCQNIDVQAMNNVGLDGGMIRNSVCASTTTANGGRVG